MVAWQAVAKAGGESASKAAGNPLAELRGSLETCRAEAIAYHTMLQHLMGEELCFGM